MAFPDQTQENTASRFSDGATRKIGSQWRTVNSRSVEFVVDASIESWEIPGYGSLRLLHDEEGSNYLLHTGENGNMTIFDGNDGLRELFARISKNIDQQHLAQEINFHEINTERNWFYAGTAAALLGLGGATLAGSTGSLPIAVGFMLILTAGLATCALALMHAEQKWGGSESLGADGV